MCISLFISYEYTLPTCSTVRHAALPNTALIDTLLLHDRVLSAVHAEAVSIRLLSSQSLSAFAPHPCGPPPPGYKYGYRFVLRSLLLDSPSEGLRLVSPSPMQP